MQTEGFENEIYLIEKIENLKDEKLYFATGIYVLYSPV